MEHTYLQSLAGLENPTFTQIQGLAIQHISQITAELKDELWKELDRGKALLTNHDQLCQYLYSYGSMHEAKLEDALSRVPVAFWKQDFEIVDWGCGQAIGSLKVLDLLKNQGELSRVKRISLIEPGKAALARAAIHVEAASRDETDIRTINKFFEELSPEEISSLKGRPRLHLFSNILDVENIDLKHLAAIMDQSAKGSDCLVAVSPIYSSSHRVEAFMEYFNSERIESIYTARITGFRKRTWTYLGKVWALKTEFNKHIKDLQNYPAAHFSAAYALDMCFAPETRKAIQESSLHHFAVSAPFDLGAQVYKDLDPLLSVLHNLIVRGVPTKASPFIESVLSEAFQVTELVKEHGALEFSLKDDAPELSISRLISTLREKPDYSPKNPELFSVYKQLVYTPIAIARFQKVLIEALLTKRLKLDAQRWDILVEEKDVPFAALAMEDFKKHFDHLSDLFDGGKTYKLPEIELSILGTAEFEGSPIHLGRSVELDKTSFGFNTYDLVISQAVFAQESEDMDRFEDFQVRDRCYFNIRSTGRKNVPRYVYTTDLLSYRPLVESDSRGNYTESDEAVGQLTYFLQLLFRKEAFRPGQLPILDRALRRLPVIGLLPTGGGKSLTYQIAALLQPGLTMVVDPLKSLMKDQYEGLLRMGIDSAIYINSSLSTDEKKQNERILESSQALFSFLSPERLGIANFRERLEAMYDRDAYFSYGVIDEVHCVSEWGHDFRFNYLHLGRNLYKHVKAREGVISLFGLTATASFDVLADVERELSANGAFDLDADTIVRFENTNRLELQYKVERVPVNFAEDPYYDTHGRIDATLPKAIVADNPFEAYDTKGEYLKGFIGEAPKYIEELQQVDSLKFIKKRFLERQNLEGELSQELSTELGKSFYERSEKYDQAGIVFCPHVNKTGVSVKKNAENLKAVGVADLSSYSGQDNDHEADENLTRFRENRSPLMVATKAFGMGIDKPNVRFTVNMNYSSSLEAFVQEAGRAGRDQKMALSTILFSDYRIAQLKRDYPVQREPIGLIYDKWFLEDDLRQILDHYNFTDYEDYLITADPTRDVVKLHCPVKNSMFQSGACNNHCSEFSRCQLKRAPLHTRGWMMEEDLQSNLKDQGLSLGKKDFKYLSPDYGANMFFYSSSFKGDFVEKNYMHRLLSVFPVRFEDVSEVKKGFLDYLISLPEGAEVFAYIEYTPDKKVPKKEEHDISINRASDLSKAIYRLTCVGLIDDFTQDYANNQFRVGLKRRAAGEYYRELELFLRRYYTHERAAAQMEKVKNIELPSEVENPLKHEIYQCLNFLIQFVYEKVSEKRKRAIDDIRNFCITGLKPANWLEANEELKDYIYYYFNSKYARREHLAPNGEPFSLVEDTQEGKYSDSWIVGKYLRVIDDRDPAVETETPLDNIKHLHGAIRLLSRSLTDSNPALYLLEAFCLAYLNPGTNKNLITQLESRFSDGMTEFYERMDGKEEFWELFHTYNLKIKAVWSSERLDEMIKSIELIVHLNRFKQIKNRYLAT